MPAYILSSWADWFDLDKQLEYMDSLGHQIDVVCSSAVLGVLLRPAGRGRSRRRHPCGTRRWPARRRNIPAGVWASAAVPLLDTKIAIEVLDDAVNRLGLMGVNMPGSIGSDARIDAERLQPFYARVASLACRCSCIRPMRCSSTCSTATTARCT